MASERRLETDDGTAIADARFGFWASLGTALATLVTFVIAVLTPPLSGPLCPERCFDYPYLDIASRFPRDYYWMFPAILATLLYVAMMVALRARAAPRGRLLAELGVCLGTMAALVLVGDYFLQLAVVQPSVLADEGDGISLLSQYNPHGLFIGLEELGFVLMSVSLACMTPAAAGPSRVERAFRWLVAGGCLVILVSLGAFVAHYGHGREYRFEIFVISVDWIVVIAGGSLAAAMFRRDLVAARLR